MFFFMPLSPCFSLNRVIKDKPDKRKQLHLCRFFGIYFVILYLLEKYFYIYAAFKVYVK